MKLKEIKALLESANIELGEKQIKALGEFFESYTAKVRKDEQKRIKANSDVEMISKDDAEKAFKKFQKDAATAFNLFKEDSKKAFALFKKDAKKAFQMYSEDLQNEYTESMVKGLEELYTDVENRVTKDFLESKDVKVLNDVKKVVAPLLVAEKEQVLLEEIDRLKAERQVIEKETKELSRDKLINELVSDFPEEYIETVKEFISTGQTEDDIYERFSTACDFIEKSSSKKEIVEDTKGVKKNKKAITEEKKTKEKSKVKKTQRKQKKVITEDLDKKGRQVIESKSKKPDPINEKETSLFTEEEQALLNMINF